jgi:hypothetical protein
VAAAGEVERGRAVGGLADDLDAGLAAVVRHTAGAIGGYVFVLLVLPVIVAGLPSSIGNQIARLLPCRSAG